MFKGGEISSQGSLRKNMYHQDAIKTLAKAYLSSRECSVQDVIYYILPEMESEKNLSVCFIYKILLEGKFWVLLAEKN